VRRSLLLLSLLAPLACEQSGRRSPDARDARLEWRFPDSGKRDRGRADIVPPGSDRCAGAATLLLTDHKVAVQGTTVGAGNEYGSAVRCGEATALAGPQRYYKLTLSELSTYRVTLKPDFDAALYLVSDCSANIINADCGSAGQSGDFTGPVAAGATATLTFAPPAGGDYLLAVDSASATSSGTFQLAVEEFTSAPNGTCTTAAPLALVNDSASVQGTTLGAKNEFGQQITCRLGLDFDGPQAYYSVALQANTWYRLSLAADFSASLVVFNSAAGCKPVNIEADCGGRTGTVLPLVPAGVSRATAFSPPVDGTYVIAVDSSAPSAAGQFTLDVVAFSPEASMICEAAPLLSFSKGKASAAGDTSRLLNDLGAHVSCGITPPLVAPQAYHRAALKKSTYRIALQPTFPAVLAVGSSCLTLPVDCGSGGLSGAVVAVAAGSTGSVLFTPPAAGSYVIAVDGTTVTGAGTYSLVVQEFTPPINGVCTAPLTLPLAASPAQELGDTGPLANDLSGVSCGLSQGPWPGPQAYYKVSLTKGVTYHVELAPEPTFDPALYAFPAATACATTAVNAACQGLASDTLGAGIKESLIIKPAASGDYILVVDSWSTSEVGAFTLSVSW
jgi:hypothetical protein